MTIHYRDQQGRMHFISKVHHIQNLNDNIFLILQDGKEAEIRVTQIEGIWHEDKEN